MLMLPRTLVYFSIVVNSRNELILFTTEKQFKRNFYLSLNLLSVEIYLSHNAIKNYILRTKLY